MKSTKIKLTNRKFYNKWLYKVTLEISGIYHLRYFDYLVEDIRNISDNINLSVIPVIEELKKIPEHQIRIERKYLDIYLNDENHFDTLRNKFYNILVHSFKPRQGLDESSDDKSVIVSKFPHNKYRYKVFLRPHAVPDKNDKAKFIKWLETQNSRVLITDTVKNWFIVTSWNWDRRYMYVENEETLLMLKMRQSEAIGTVHRFVVNT